MERLNQLVESRSWPSWLAGGVVAALVFGGATLFVAGTYDLVAVAAAAVSGSAGMGAAWLRRQLDAQPFELAPTAARSHEQVLICGWLGRGRRIDDLEVTAELEADGARHAVEVYVPRGPMVGRFLAVIRSPAVGRLHVTVVLGVGGKTEESRHTFEPASIVDGRFEPGLTTQGGRLVFRPAEWGRVRTEAG